MKTAISLPDPLFKRAEAVAHHLHVTRSELYARALERFLRDHDEAAVRAALDDVYGDEAAELPAGAARAQAEVLSPWEEEP